MQDPGETLRRYKTTMAPTVGPEGYGRWRIPGGSPPPQIVFFDDYTQILSNNPTGNYYGESDRNISEGRVDTYTESTYTQWQLFMKFERPVTRPRLIILPNDSGPVAGYETGGSIYYSTISPFTIWKSLGRASVHCRLIAVPLEAGKSNTYGLDALTWNNSHVDPYSSTNGTLYDTATNYADWTEKIVISPGSPNVYDQPQDNQLINTQTTGAYVAHMQYSNGYDEESGKVYYGIHLYFDNEHICDVSTAAIADGDEVRATFAFSVGGFWKSPTQPAKLRPCVICADYSDSAHWGTNTPP